ncbi:hypothetical protein L195_g064176, partial [Trifolium pratense]
LSDKDYRMRSVASSLPSGNPNLAKFPTYPIILSTRGLTGDPSASLA